MVGEVLCVWAIFNRALRTAMACATLGFLATGIVMPSAPTGRLHAVLFDIDGTLFNSDALHLAVFQVILAEEGYNDGKRIDEAFFMQRIVSASPDANSWTLITDIAYKLISPLADMCTFDSLSLESRTSSFARISSHTGQQLKARHSLRKRSSAFAISRRRSCHRS